MVVLTLNRNVMKKPISLIIIVLSLTGLSNVIGQGNEGNGNVVEQERTVEEFSGISVKEGIELILTQGDKYSVVVITDENLQDEVITKVDNGDLKIYPENVRNPTRLTIKVEFISISAISAKEGVEVEGTTPFELDELAISCLEGCEMSIELNAENLALSLVEGCEMRLKGTINSIALSIVEGCELSADINGEDIACSIVEGSEVDLDGKYETATYSVVEGSELSASNLIAENCTVSANEGSEADVYATKNLVVDARGESEVKYSGNPESKQIKSCEGCEVKAQ